MTKDFEARALEKAEEYFQNEAVSWGGVEFTPASIRAAFLAGARYGRAEGLDEAAEIISTELHDLEEAEFLERGKERINIRAWLMNARACIRAAKEKK